MERIDFEGLRKINFTKLRIVADMTIAMISSELGVDAFSYRNWQRWSDPDYSGINQNEPTRRSLTKIHEFMEKHDITTEQVT